MSALRAMPLRLPLSLMPEISVLRVLLASPPLAASIPDTTASILP